jgi:hypothetical protein
LFLLEREPLVNIEDNEEETFYLVIHVVNDHQVYYSLTKDLDTWNDDLQSIKLVSVKFKDTVPFDFRIWQLTGKFPKFRAFCVRFRDFFESIEYQTPSYPLDLMVDPENCEENVMETVQLVKKFFPDAHLIDSSPYNTIDMKKRPTNKDVQFSLLALPTFYNWLFINDKL